MNLDQYRLKPLPPTKRAFWRRVLIATVTIFLIAVLTYAFIYLYGLTLFIPGRWHLR